MALAEKFDWDQPTTDSFNKEWILKSTEPQSCNAKIIAITDTCQKKKEKKRTLIKNFRDQQVSHYNLSCSLDYH